MKHYRNKIIHSNLCRCFRNETYCNINGTDLNSNNGGICNRNYKLTVHMHLNVHL